MLLIMKGGKRRGRGKRKEHLKSFFGSADTEEMEEREMALSSVFTATVSLTLSTFSFTSTSDSFGLG